MWRCIQDARLIGSPKNRWNQEIARLPNGFLPSDQWSLTKIPGDNRFSGIFRITIGL